MVHTERGRRLCDINIGICVCIMSCKALKTTTWWLTHHKGQWWSHKNFVNVLVVVQFNTSYPSIGLIPWRAMNQIRVIRGKMKIKGVWEEQLESKIKAIE